MKFHELLEALRQIAVNEKREVIMCSLEEAYSTGAWCVDYVFSYLPRIALRVRIADYEEEMVRIEGVVARIPSNIVPAKVVFNEEFSKKLSSLGEVDVEIGSDEVKVKVKCKDFSEALQVINRLVEIIRSWSIEIPQKLEVIDYEVCAEDDN